MTETFVFGLIHGLTIALLAVGLVLVYKANRFINLGHAQLGAVPAVLLAKLVIDWGVSWWLAFPVAVGIGLLTGLVVERSIIRPLRAKGRGTGSLLLVSIGVAQLLSALLFVPALRPNNNELAAQGYPLPFDASVTVGGVVVNAQLLLIVALVPLLILGLGVFLRYTLMGKMIRGAASNQEAARLCGVPVGRVSAVTWGIAGALSAVSAVLLAPSQGGFDAAQLAPELLLRALGAAAVGGFVSVPAAAVGGVGLGLVEQYALHFTRDSADALLVVFAAILLVFIFRARTISAAASSEITAGADRAPLRVPAAVAGLFVVRHQRLILAAVGVVVGAVFPLLPYFRTDAHRFLLTLILVYAMVGVALTVLVGWAGQVSLGHFALVGVGAFITARLSPHEWSIPALLVLSGLAGAAILVVTGLPALRLRGLTMAVTSLGVAVVAPVWLFRQPWFGTDAPFGTLVEPVAVASRLGRPFDQIEVYYTALVVLGLALAVASALRRSVPGRLVVAVRDNETATASFGVTPAAVKLGILAASGFLAGSSGVLWALAWRNTASTQFNPALSLSVLAVPVIGGLGSLPGAIVGALLLYVPAFFMTPLTEAVFGEFSAQVGFQLALGGAGLVAILMIHPTGVAGAAQTGWERVLARLARRRGGGPTTAVEPSPAPTIPAPARAPLRVSGNGAGRPAGSAAGVGAGAAAEPPLAVEDLQLSFGGIRALDGAAIRVDRGEIVGLIGPNGAGKTTLLNAVSGVLHPKAGSVEVFGEELVDLPPEFRHGFGLSRSFQDARLFPGLTATETVQVAMSAANRVGLVSSALGAPWAREVEYRTRAEARAFLERLQLTPWAASLTAELSTGTRRICDLAAQLAAGPDLLLLDEPTAGVAQREVEVFPPLLRRIRDELGCSILVVEHDMPLLMGLCDRVYAMVAGRVVAEGTPEQIRTNPAVIASYLGTDEIAISRSGRRPATATAGPVSDGRRRRGEQLAARSGRAPGP